MPKTPLHSNFNKELPQKNHVLIIIEAPNYFQSKPQNPDAHKTQSPKPQILKRKTPNPKLKSNAPN